MPFTPPPLLEPLYIIFLALAAYATNLWVSPFPLATLSSRSGALFQKALRAFPHPTAASQITLHARGVVLDLGPGIGFHLPAFREPVQQGKIKKIYGFEPNSFTHADLMENVKKEGLGDVYEIVGLGVEDAEDFFKAEAGNAETEDGFVDTVVCIHVLCSVLKPQEMIKALWELLKKDGGQMVVWEHIGCRERFLGQFGQVLYGPFFKFLVGNCHLNRQTDEMILRAGSWETVELEIVGQKEAEWGIFPHISGRVVKGASYSSGMQDY